MEQSWHYGNCTIPSEFCLRQPTACGSSDRPTTLQEDSLNKKTNFDPIRGGFYTVGEHVYYQDREGNLYRLLVNDGVHNWVYVEPPPPMLLY